MPTVRRPDPVRGRRSPLRPFSTNEREPHLLRVAGTSQTDGSRYPCLKINGLFQSCVIAIDHGASGSTALCFQPIAVVNSFTVSAIAARWYPHMYARACV